MRRISILEVVVFRKLVLAAVPAAALVVTFATPALAGSPHFVGAPVFSSEGRTLTVSAKEAGLGNEEQIHVVLSATALCLNGGGNHPKATNKTSVTAADDVPVQNGKAVYSLSATAAFTPDPPGACGAVSFEDVTVTDTTNGLVASP